jgi:uncharacterized damage-inducible protein DinB
LKKQDLIEHNVRISEWVHSLKEADDEAWLVPTAEGKWAPAAIVSHMLFWDQYSLTERFPYFAEGAKLPNFPDFQKINDEAEAYALSGTAKEEILRRFAETRARIIQLLEGLEDSDLDKEFFIGGNKISAREYFMDFAEHDLHHKEQVEQFFNARRG